MADGAWAEAGEDFRGIVDWEEAAAAAAAAGSPLIGLPQGLRVRKNQGKEEAPTPTPHLAVAPDGRDTDSSTASTNRWGLRLPSGRDLFVLAFFVIGSLLMLALQRATRSSPALADVACRQCNPTWWDDFWAWRLEDASKEHHAQAPAPDGMEWEWDTTANRTDWFGVSGELVDKVIKAHVELEGPILHVGCGDSPLPELLYKAGYHDSDHLDIVPQVVEKMVERYDPGEWPGLRFQKRDFLGEGPPPPEHRYAAVIDKAGLWDWLQDEAPQRLPHLLAKASAALRSEPTRGVYIIVTKQTPIQLSETLAVTRSNFLVEASQRLGAKGIAWAYVLEPL